MIAPRTGRAILVAAMLVLAGAASRAEEVAPAASDKAAAPAPQSVPTPKPADVLPDDPDADKPIASPFGDRYDPNKPPPVAPVTKGPGITSVKLVAAGPSDLKELPKPPSGQHIFYSVVADITLPKDSTTDVLGPASITLTPAEGEPVKLFAACMPNLEDADAVSIGEGTRIAGWTVLIGEQSWRCGGRTARMALRVGAGGFRLTASRADMNTPMVLVFEGQDKPPKSVTIAGKSIELPSVQQDAKPAADAKPQEAK